MIAEGRTHVLLDTHVLVWMLAGDERLSREARQLIENASYEDGADVCAISLWEVSMLAEKGRLPLFRDVGAWVESVATHPALNIVPLAPEIAVASTRLPGELHRDPADRMIVATARTVNATLVTADRALLEYGAQGHVRVLAASGSP